MGGFENDNLSERPIRNTDFGLEITLSANRGVDVASMQSVDMLEETWNLLLRSDIHSYRSSVLAFAKPSGKTYTNQDGFVVPKFSNPIYINTAFIDVKGAGSILLLHEYEGPDSEGETEGLALDKVLAKGRLQIELREEATSANRKKKAPNMVESAGLYTALPLRGSRMIHLDKQEADYLKHELKFSVESTVEKVSLSSIQKSIAAVYPDLLDHTLVNSYRSWNSVFDRNVETFFQYQLKDIFDEFRLSKIPYKNPLYVWAKCLEFMGEVTKGQIEQIEEAGVYSYPLRGTLEFGFLCWDTGKVHTAEESYNVIKRIIMDEKNLDIHKIEFPSHKTQIEFPLVCTSGFIRLFKEWFLSQQNLRHK